MENEIKKEENFTDAETFEIEGEEAEIFPKKKRRADFYIELVLFLILGILLGFAIKKEADKRIAIGFDDYKMKIFAQDYDINKIELDLAKKSAAATASQPENGSAPQPDLASPDQATEGQTAPTPDTANPVQ